MFFFLWLDLHSTVKRYVSPHQRFAETCDWAVVQLQSIGRSESCCSEGWKYPGVEISASLCSVCESLCGQRLRATCTAAELQPPSLRSKTPLQMKERRGSDTSAYQAELTGRGRWTGACKGGRKKGGLPDHCDWYQTQENTRNIRRVDAVWPWQKEQGGGLVSLRH